MGADFPGSPVGKTPHCQYRDTAKWLKKKKKKKSYLVFLLMK